jgi:hypothetical protein
VELGVLQAEAGWEEKLEGAGNKDNEEELMHVSGIRKKPPRRLTKENSASGGMVTTCAALVRRCGHLHRDE